MNRTMFAYSFQGLSHIRKEEDPDNSGKLFPCQDRSFSGDFEASEIPEKKDIQLFVDTEAYNNYEKVYFFFHLFLLM